MKAQRQFYPIRSIASSEGSTTDDLDNLCLCCIRCNLKKGPNIVSADPETGHVVPLFHPRRHFWPEHFSLSEDGWDDCQTFLDRLNAQVAGLAARLPTEAEWERACRGGTQGATWIGELSGEVEASELDAIAWYHGNSDEETHPVGRKAPNPYGLYDMLGNVFEWCSDATDESGARYRYTSKRAVDPVSSGQGPLRVSRGGSWYSSERNVRAANRLADGRGYRNPDVGFRLAGA